MPLSMTPPQYRHDTNGIRNDNHLSRLAKAATTTTSTKSNSNHYDPRYEFNIPSMMRYQYNLNDSMSLESAAEKRERENWFLVSHEHEYQNARVKRKQKHSPLQQQEKKHQKPRAVPKLNLDYCGNSGVAASPLHASGSSSSKSSYIRSPLTKNSGTARKFNQKSESGDAGSITVCHDKTKRDAYKCSKKKIRNCSQSEMSHDDDNNRENSTANQSFNKHSYSSYSTHASRRMADKEENRSHHTVKTSGELRSHNDKRKAAAYSAKSQHDKENLNQSLSKKRHEHDKFFDDREQRLHDLRQRLEQQYPLFSPTRKLKTDSDEKTSTLRYQQENTVASSNRSSLESFASSSHWTGQPSQKSALEPYDASVYQSQSVDTSLNGSRQKIEERFYSSKHESLRRKKRNSPRKKKAFSPRMRSKKNHVPSPIRSPPLHGWKRTAVNNSNQNQTREIPSSNNSLHSSKSIHFGEDFLKEDIFAGSSKPLSQKAPEKRQDRTQISDTGALFSEDLEEELSLEKTLYIQPPASESHHKGSSSDASDDTVGSYNTHRNDRLNCSSILSKVSDTLEKFSTKYQEVDHLISSGSNKNLHRNLNSSSSHYHEPEGYSSKTYHTSRWAGMPLQSNNKENAQEQRGAAGGESLFNIQSRIDRNIQELRENMKRLKLSPRGPKTSFSVMHNRYNGSHSSRSSSQSSKNSVRCDTTPKDTPLSRTNSATSLKSHSCRDSQHHHHQKSTFSIFDTLLTNDIQQHSGGDYGNGTSSSSRRLYRFRDAQFS